MVAIATIQSEGSWQQVWRAGEDEDDDFFVFPLLVVGTEVFWAVILSKLHQKPLFKPWPAMAWPLKRGTTVAQCHSFSFAEDDAPDVFI